MEPQTCDPLGDISIVSALALPASSAGGQRLGHLCMAAILPIATSALLAAKRKMWRASLQG